MMTRDDGHDYLRFRREFEAEWDERFQPDPSRTRCTDQCMERSQLASNAINDANDRPISAVRRFSRSFKLALGVGPQRYVM